MKQIALPAVVVAALLASTLTACARSSVCIDYGFYDGDAEAMTSASLLVVSGSQTPTGETVELYDARVSVHEIEIDEVLQGEVEGDTITAVAPPGGCFDVGSAVAAEDDILNVDGTARFFLVWYSDHWLTLTPYEGVLPIDIYR